MGNQISFTFRVSRGDDLQREEQLTVDIPGVVKIGKLESSNLRIDDDENVSRMHALIEISSPNDIHVLDLGSAKGTLLNGEPVKKGRLADGGELTLGDTTVVVGIAVAAEQAAPAPAAQASVSGPAAMPPAAMPPGAGSTPMAPPIGGIPGPMPGFGAPPLGPSPMAVPTMPALDMSVERQDGSRAIEVTALFEDEVVEVRHLDNPAAGKVNPLSWALAVSGWGIVLGGLGLSIGGQTGFAGVLYLVGLAFGVYGVIRIREERRSPDFVLGGTESADLNLSHPSIPAAAFPLVKSDGTQYSLLYTEGMTGDVTLGSDRMELSQLADSGRAQPDPSYPQTRSFPIPAEARIKLDIGRHTLLINAVAPARRVVSPFLSRVDWAAQMSNGLSFAAHALLLFLVFAVPPDAKSLSLDLFDADNEFMKYLVKPQEQKEEDIPSWLKKKGPDKAGGKGKRHKGDEGKMGSKKSKKKTGLYGLKGPKDATPRLARQLAEETARTAGVLGLLGGGSGSHIASIFGADSALGNDAVDALGGLIGNEIGEAAGFGGLGLSGYGRGGGGTGEGTIGLGTLDTIGKGGGGGSGAGYGSGAGRLGGRRARVPRVTAGRAEVMGSLDKEIIRRIIRRHINEVKFCYQKELMANESLAGRVIVQFTIAATGRVIVSKVQSSTLGNSKVEKCIAMAVRRWLFPKPKGGGIVHVSYPFVLKAAGS
jgi:TonB family protein